MGGPWITHTIRTVNTDTHKHTHTLTIKYVKHSNILTTMTAISYAAA